MRLSRKFSNVGYSQTAPTNIYEDSLACITMSTNPVRRKSSRHIDRGIRLHFCRELYAAGVMRLIPLRNHLMVSDALTKSLPGPALTQHREVMLGHTPFYAPLLHQFFYVYYFLVVRTVVSMGEND